MKQEEFEAKAKSASKEMLKKKAPTRPETFERPRQTGKRLTPRGIQPTVVEEIKIADMLKGLKGVRICKKAKGAIPRWFDIVMPNWMIKNEEIDILAILSSELRRRLNFYREEIPIKNKKQAQMIMIAGDMRINIDGCSMACVERDETHIIFSMNIRISNSKW